MPELPEVETIARALNSQLAGRTVLSTRLLWNRTLATSTPEDFSTHLTGQSIQQVGRRAKYIHFQLSSGHLFIHLRMSGDLYVRPADYQPEKHDRLILGLSGGSVLVFNDPRKFGRVWLVVDPAKVVGGLGPEPFASEFTAEMFYERLHKHHRQIKPLLLDQKFIAGVGNIYSDEALHIAGLHPLTQSDTIYIEKARVLFEAIRAVLQTGIDHNGASIDWVYRGGDFQNYFRVYGREGQACPVCGTSIARIIVGQRSSHFCPNCQPARER
jgi:formamidopyrimidine-DNA glycosylase